MSNEYKFFDRHLLSGSYVIEFNITKSCNLNCNQCYRYAPHFNKNDNMPFEEFKKDFDYIRSLKDFDKLDTLSFSNEPYVNKDFLEILKYARKYYKKRIIMLTNGLFFTYIPDNELKTLHDLDIHFDITHYTKSRIDYRKIENRLNQFNIKHQVFNCGFVKDFPDVMEYHAETLIFEKPLKKKFVKKLCCCFITIDSGKIYKCADLSSIHAFLKKYNLKDTVEEHVDYENLSSFKSLKEMHFFCLSNRRTGYCKYCINSKFLEAQEWSNKRIPFTDHLATKEEEELFCENLE